MSLNVSAVFRQDRKKGWFVRFRSVSRDSTVRVPPAIFTDEGLDPLARTPKHEKLALTWGLDQKRRIEKTSIDSRGPRMTLRQLWNFYKERNPNDVQGCTMVKYEQRILPVIAFFQDELSLLPEQIDLDAMEKFRDRRRVEKAAFRTIMSEMWLTKHIIKFGAERVASTGVREVRIYRLPKMARAGRKGRALSEVELFDVILPAKLTRNERRVKSMICLGIVTMLRRETLLGLQKAWIDRENRWLKIPAEFMKGPQGRKRPLSVPLCVWALEIIEKEWPYSGDSPYLFPSLMDERSPATKLERPINRIAKAAGMDHFTPHDLRRTGTTWLEEHGVNRLIRRILLGHNVEQDVLDLYTFTSREALREAVNVFDAIRKTHGSKTVSRDTERDTGESLAPSESDPSAGHRTA